MRALTDPGSEICFVKGSHRPRPLTHLCRSLIDKITPTTRSRQSLIDKRRFGAIPRTRMRQIRLHDGSQWQSEEPSYALLKTRQDVMHENQRSEVITWSRIVRVTPSLLYQVNWWIRLRGNQDLPLRRSLD